MELCKNGVERKERTQERIVRRKEKSKKKRERK